MHSRTGVRRLAAVILLCLAMPGIAACTAAENRAATETASGATAGPTQTPPGPGEFLEIDGQRAHRIYIPSDDSQIIYAMTDTWLYRREGARWFPTPTNKDARTLVVDPHDAERLYRGNHPPCFTDSREEFEFAISVDGGETWRTIPNGRNIQPLAVDEAVSDVIYGSDCGLSISTDGGETWRHYYRSTRYAVTDVVTVEERLLVLETAPTGYSQLREIRIGEPEVPEIASTLLESRQAFSVDASGSRIVVGTIRGVRVSEDGGNTWTISREGLEEVTREAEMTLPPAEFEPAEPVFGVLTVRIDPAHDSRIFAGTVRGLFISQDQGATWDRYSAVGIDARVLDITFGASGNDIYVTTPEGVIVVPNP